MPDTFHDLLGPHITPDEAMDVEELGNVYVDYYDLS